MSADRPPAPVEPGHPLHAILNGHARPRDRDSGQAEHRDDDATLEPGPPRTPSAGRPLEPAAVDELFTPPVPSIETLRGLLDDRPDDVTGREGRSRPRRSRTLASVLATVSVPRPSKRLAAALVVVSAVIVAAFDRPHHSPPPRTAAAPLPWTPAADGPETRRPTSRSRRRSRSQATRRARWPQARRPSTRSTPVVQPTAAPPEPSRSTRVLSAAPTLAAAPPASRFTAEFTP